MPTVRPVISPSVRPALAPAPSQAAGRTDISRPASTHADTFVASSPPPRALLASSGEGPAVVTSASVNQLWGTRATAAAADSLPADYARWKPFVMEAAQRYNLSPALIYAVMARESNGQNVVGDAGHGRGLMQIDDRTWGSWIASHNGGMDPESNILKGAEILRSNLDFFHGNERLAADAYNAGPGTVQNAVNSWAT